MVPANREDSGRNPDGTFKPGVSGNPNGRPKDTLKAFIARELRDMDDDQKRAWLKEHKIPGELMWRMGEGNPATNLDHTSGGKELTVVIAGESAIRYGVSPKPEDSSA